MYPQPPIIIQQPQPRSGSIGLHPLTIMIIAAVFLIAFGFFFFTFGNVIEPLANGISNSIGINLSASTHILIFGESVADIVFVLLIIMIAFLNVVYAYLYPSRAMGFLDIGILIFIGYFWLAIKVPLVAVAPALGIVQVFPLFYAFFVSNYYIAITAVFLVLSIIMNMQ